jgi:putative transposase
VAVPEGLSSSDFGEALAALLGAEAAGLSASTIVRLKARWSEEYESWRKRVWPEARSQRCWVHKLANVLHKLPKRLQPRAKQALHEIVYAPTRAEARAAIDRFREAYAAKYPKAVASLEEGRDELLTFFDFPAEHWAHLRTTNPIESTFATLGLRRKKTCGRGSRSAALALAFKLLESAEKRWRKLNAPHLVELVCAGVRFEDGVRTKSTAERDAA